MASPASRAVLSDDVNRQEDDDDVDDVFPDFHEALVCGGDTAGAGASDQILASTYIPLRTNFLVVW